MRITVWNEFQHEKRNEKVTKIYPNGIHAVIADGLREHGFTDVRTATLDEPQHGLTDEVLASTDVMFWWGHMAHDQVSDAVRELRMPATISANFGILRRSLRKITR